MSPTNFRVDLGISRVRLNLESKVVTEVHAAGFLSARQDTVRIAHHTKIDIFRRTCTFEAKFDRQSALENDRILEDTEKPGEVSIEHEQLPAAMEIHA